jgi:hypothetical protein
VSGTFFVLHPDRYYAAVAYVSGVAPIHDSDAVSCEQDWLGLVWRDHDGPWTLAYRFRYYEDREVWESGDLQNEYAFLVEGPVVEDAVVERLLSVAAMVEERFNAEADVVRPRTSDPALILKELEGRPWAHFRHLQ